MRNFGLDAWVSRISTQKPCLTIPAAIGSQAKKWENGMLQEVLPVRRSHIRTMTLRAWSRSRHKTDLYLVPSEEKVQEKWVIAWVTNQVGRTLINGSRAIARCSKLGGACQVAAQASKGAVVSCSCATAKGQASRTEPIKNATSPDASSLLCLPDSGPCNSPRNNR